MSKSKKIDYNKTATESEIQSSILSYLEYKGYKAFRTNAGNFFMENKRGKKSMIKGLPKGFPDIMVFVHGKSKVAIPGASEIVAPNGKKLAQTVDVQFPTVAFIEVKKEGGELREDQIKFRDEYVKFGFTFHTFKSLDECMAVFK